ncbi:hypothetical protein NMG60_11016094 [Bertholletia excelsa]
MEEMWKGLSLPSPYQHPMAAASHHHAYNFQDFLTRPSDKLPPTRATNDSQEPLSAPPCRCASALSLSYSQKTSHPSLANVGSVSPPLGDSVFASLCKKRATEIDENSGDQRHKRMMKNRESAARSRARKQAYTYQLENEVARLMAENAKLRRQLDKYRSAASDKIPKRGRLERTLTAPF